MSDKQVYVIEAAIGVIKIGCSRWPQQRADYVSSHSPSPVRLIAVLPGGGREERQFHARFSEFRSHNEWFLIDGAVADFVREIFGTGLDRVQDWDECDRSPLHERKLQIRARLSAAAKARWADPQFRERQAAYRSRRAAVHAKPEAA